MRSYFNWHWWAVCVGLNIMGDVILRPHTVLASIVIGLAAGLGACWVVDS